MKDLICSHFTLAMKSCQLKEIAKYGEVKEKSPTTPVGRGMMKPPRRGQTTSGTRSTELIL
jgi:hypothetical protein